ncbi:hypothetical protein [Streptomyces californicus]
MTDEKSLLERLIKAYAEFDAEREATFRDHLQTYDPRPGEQPCEDWEMGEYDQLEAAWDAGAETLLGEFVQELRLYLGMESNE